MIRHLHPTDSPALLQFKQRSGPDEVRSLARVLQDGQKNFPLVKYTTVALSPRAWQSCWVKTRRAGVQAVLRAGTRSGPLAWEISEFYLARSSREVATEVLEQIAFPAGASDARRIFLRVPEGSELFDAARAAGYMPAYSETLYGVESARDALSQTGSRPMGLELRQLGPEDQHALYRLFCATVPIDVRTKTGQTLDEWNSSSENPGRKKRHLGVDDSKTSRLAAQITSCDVSGGRYFSVQAVPGANYDIDSLIAAGIGHAGEERAFTLVPSYDQKMAETLMEIGFTQGETYDVMVKTLAVRVGKTVPGMVASER